ncbi:hypothetical protein SOVF_024560 [Spinacia oleracea]|uniref:G-patch domain-containing protein n=1 Tax=Spinacia oleracea TaxID=3562 RepID=A0A9R0J4Z2_SPIOL|nr:uncharacterized protein LOC110799625 [Spinacia oleracea]KNA23462.1 hypothetical protein SOVF_024560 [Spinacia oleracea]
MEGADTIDEEVELCNQPEHSHNQEDSFVWDDNSQLYFHARSGFYHNPNEGWYYSTSDGFYYKFEDGNYKLYDSYNKDYQSVTEGGGECDIDESLLQAVSKEEYDQNNQEIDGVAHQIGECTSNALSENPPPSEWLEDTLIELYLSGYPNTTSEAAENQQLPKETDDEDGFMLTADGNSKLYEQGDAELSLDQHTATDSSASVFHEDASWEEENWRAQYGQVVQQENELGTGIHITDMWDWSMVREIHKERSSPVARIVGRLVQPSSKLHPSVPSHGRRLRTAPICKVHLDLVQVRSGQVYKLRTPSAKYIATLSDFDASNPTRDWGFPELSTDAINEKCESKTTLQVFSQQCTNLGHDNPSDYEKHKTNVYRDRAAERRELHGSFGEAPGQKRSADDASPPSTEEAAAEALEMSLGAGSYAQKILKNMGWKQGEGLGKTQHGLKEPLQGIGNKGTAGLGWNSRRRN